MPDTNPLLQQWDLPPWTSIRAEHLVPAVSTIIADNRRNIAHVITSQVEFPNWDDLVLAVDETDARLNETLGIIQVSSLEQRGDVTWTEAIATCSDLVAQYRSEIMSNRPLYETYQRLANSPIARNFDESRTAALNKILREFRLSGIELTFEQQAQLSRLNRDIDRCEKVFLSNLERANAAWTKRIDDIALLEGLYPTVKDRLALLAKNAGHDGWLIPLDQNTYRQIMPYAQNRALREEYFRAYHTRASDQGPHAGQFDNQPTLTTLLSLRHQRAQLLGFENFAQLSLANAMAESTAQVSDFLQHQVKQTQSALERESKGLDALAAEMGIEKVEAWDREFLAEQLSQRDYPGALKNLRDYFPLETTLNRLHAFSERMFGVRISEVKNFSPGHDTVRLFAVSEHEQTLGHIYLSPFHRKEAPDYAWTGTPRNRRMNAEGRLVLPIAYLNCNFTPGVDGQPCLLDHLGLRVLFHEFGHCLQHVLTGSPHHRLSGISQFGRDSAEFAGQVFEQWCLSQEFLIWLSSHYQSGEHLPEKHAVAALTALESQTAYQTATLLLSAMFDFEAHRCQGDGRSIQQVFDDVLQTIPSLPWPAYGRLANSFDYLVTGYGASVYAYKWSGVLATEAFKRFQHDWVFNPQTGRDFRQAFFSPGDARSLITSLQLFLKQPIDPALFATSTSAEVG